MFCVEIAEKSARESLFRRENRVEFWQRQYAVASLIRNAVEDGESQQTEITIHGEEERQPEREGDDDTNPGWITQ